MSSQSSDGSSSHSCCLGCLSTTSGCLYGNTVPPAASPGAKEWRAVPSCCTSTWHWVLCGTGLWAPSCSGRRLQTFFINLNSLNNTNLFHSIHNSDDNIFSAKFPVGNFHTVHWWNKPFFSCYCKWTGVSPGAVWCGDGCCGNDCCSFGVSPPEFPLLPV